MPQESHEEVKRAAKGVQGEAQRAGVEELKRVKKTGAARPQTRLGLEVSSLQ